MATQDRSSDDARSGDAENCVAALRVEMRSSEQGLLAAFRDSFLQWVNDRAVNRVSRTIGAPDKIAFDNERESADDESNGTLRLHVFWGLDEGAPAFADEPVIAPSSRALPPMSYLASTERFELLSDPWATPPLYRDHIPSIQPESLGVAAERARQDLTARQAFGHELSQAALLTIRNLREATRVAMSQPLFERIRKHPFWQKGFSVRLRTSSAPLGFAVRRVTPAGGLLAVAGAVVIGVLVITPLVRPVASGDSQPPLAARGALPPTVEKAAPSTAAVTPRATDAVAASSQAPVSRIVAEPKSAAFVPGRPDPFRSVESREAVRTTGTRVVSARATTGTPRERQPTLVKRAEPGIVGSLLVKSEPVGAEVSINGVSLGRTPLRIQGLSAGSRVVRLDLAGYERWSWAIAVRANGQTVVNVKMQPDARVSMPN